ncbi:tetratricopeptide repeat protein [Gemmata sp. JC673]|uniref:Tetratricopeptide repeat protein n=1 Tax=Gemmata algarum TaxID=2975278 RepID=A0ABU5F3Z8_9BACT|nr:tetratricopeptide repeat protein [Gemmata algarum]MDY3562055.1 tetratricopeptide repeat protein [Gemmata algarum]
MALRKSITGGPPAVPAAPASRKRWAARVAVALAFGAAAWGAWAALAPDPLRDARAALDRRDFRTASDILIKRLTGRPDDPDARLLAARAARREGDFAVAREHLRKFEQAHPPTAAYEFESDLLAAYTGSAAHADKLFAASTAAPDGPDAPWALEAFIEGTLKSRVPYSGAQFDPERDDPALVTKLHTAAEQWLARRAGRPDQVQGLTWQGRIYGYAGELDKSLAKYRAALALDPDHFEARYHLAVALVQSAPDECLKHFDVLIQQKPGNRFLRFLVATTRRRFGQFEGARRTLDAMLATDPNDIAALVELAQLDLDEHRPAAAEPLLQRALRVGPNVPEAHLAMSRCLQLSGRPDEAQRARKRFEDLEAERTARGRRRGAEPPPGIAAPGPLQ